MSKIVIKPIEEQIRGARIAGELARAEERGYAKGFEEGRAKGRAAPTVFEEKLVLGLLKTKTPEEISKNFEISLERIHEIINGIIKKL